MLLNHLVSQREPSSRIVRRIYTASPRSDRPRGREPRARAPRRPGRRPTMYPDRPALPLGPCEVSRRAPTDCPVKRHNAGFPVSPQPVTQRRRWTLNFDEPNSLCLFVRVSGDSHGRAGLIASETT